MNEKVVVIGGGMGGLGTAALLAKKGYDVTVLEKNERLGGVANWFEAEGFRFDMGPSWYLMPHVFRNFFELCGERVEDHLDLIRLEPSYRIFFKDQNRHYDFYSDLERDIETFEELEPGSGAKLREYLERSKLQYEISLDGFMYKNYNTVFDFLNKQTATQGRQLSVFESMNRYVERYFESDAVRKIMEYQLVFLGSSPYNTPALYNIMSHIDFNMGVWYPRGGITQIPAALQKIGEKHGAKYHLSTPVRRILTKSGPKVRGVWLENGEKIDGDIVVSNASIHHTETRLLPSPYRTFSPRYWKTRTLAPSALIIYLGIRGKADSLAHHNLLFAADWQRNFKEIFDEPQWPSDPSLYVCAPSQTDDSVAPEGHENLLILVPISPHLEYSDSELEAYADKTLRTIEREMKVENLRERIVYKRLFSIKDFAATYNTQSGTALGLAHTMTQTAIFRPNNFSKKVRNLFYAGANTNPGIGMPICLISAELAYKRIIGDKSAGHLESL